MVITFKRLKLENFKIHRDLDVKFGDLLKITADNGLGKSSIPEAITWSLYGMNPFNIKVEYPTPITYESEYTMVSLLLNIDGKDLLLGRELKKGKLSYYINEIPSKATDFNNLVNELFDKELFLSMFNPLFFFTLHPDKQRAMMLKYIPAPVKKDVLKTMNEEQSNCLKPLLMKHPIDDLQNKYKKNKTDFDKKYIQVQTKHKTLKEQLDQLSSINTPIESLKAELAQIDKQVREKERQLDDIWEKNKAYNDVQNELHRINDQVKASKDRWPALRDEVIEDTCRTCKRPLEDESIKAVQEDLEHRKDNYKKAHKELVDKRDELKNQLETLEFIDAAELRAEIKQIDESAQPLRTTIRDYAHYERLVEQVKQAELDEIQVHQALKEAIFILDSIKAFHAKEAELQAEKVQALFDTLSVRLFKQNKGDGEIKTDFEIMMDGKPYRTLSLSESIRAGLELREVLSKQSDLIMPVFVDNAESITRFKEPSGQLIISRVVAGQELKIEGAAK